jgi:hypothetical protein
MVVAPWLVGGTARHHSSVFNSALEDRPMIWTRPPGTDNWILSTADLRLITAE